MLPVLQLKKKDNKLKCILHKQLVDSISNSSLTIYMKARCKIWIMHYNAKWVQAFVKVQLCAQLVIYIQRSMND